MYLKIKNTRVTRLTPHRSFRGITLVEMLISMAITLVMMAAVVNLFANIGSGVRNRRASMELGSQLRAARARLFKDLAGVTCPVRPKLPSDDHDDGYFELIEGQYSDKNPSLLVQANNIDAEDSNGNPIGLRHQTSLVPRDNSGRLVQWVDDNNNGIVDSNERGSVRSSGSALGDYDDILAMTVRSESEPFVGRMPVWNTNTNRWGWQTIESDLAEVIWYAVENPADGSLGEPGMRTVYRRVLLIAPWVTDLPAQVIPTGNLSYSALDRAKVLELDQMYYQLSDISYRRVVETNDPTDPSDDVLLRVPNTLADLTRRENRFGHRAHPYTGNLATSFPIQTNYPHEMDVRGIRIDPTNRRRNFPQDLGGFSIFHPFGIPFEWDPGTFDTATSSIDAVPNVDPGQSVFKSENSPGNDRLGEDIMLNDVLAFDLRVYDPGAPLYQSAAGFALEPSDHGWENAYENTEISESGPVFDDMVGQGAFVDLGYVDARSLTPVPPNDPSGPQPLRPVFSGLPHTKSLLNFSGAANPIRFIVYDTWPYHYEADGLDQDGDWIDTNGNNQIDPAIDENIDEGTDGLDTTDFYDLDNNPSTALVQSTIYGTDDPGERETQPPYDHPLRAMQAKIRIYDREARQIREATITRNFVPQ